MGNIFLVFFIDLQSYPCPRVDIRDMIKDSDSAISPSEALQLSPARVPEAPERRGAPGGDPRTVFYGAPLPRLMPPRSTTS